MIYRIEVSNKQGIASPQAEGVRHELSFFGYDDVDVLYSAVYLIDIDAPVSAVERIAREVLADPVTEQYRISTGMAAPEPAVEVAFNPGVMDPVALTVEKAVRDLGVTSACTIRTGRKYTVSGSRLPDAEVYRKFLFNPLIEHLVDADKVRAVTSLNEFANVSYTFKKIEVDLLNADDDKLVAISKQGCLSLTLDEMKAIKAYFAAQGRNPTDCELETIAQTWSEHCNHKTFRGLIEYQETDIDGNTKTEVIDNLLKSTIARATTDINHPMCVSVFKDNAGIVKFTKDTNLCFKVETHNHPSSLEPYGGASTGVGGVIRDILGVGLGGFPVANTDVFCFGNPDMAYEKVPAGMHHPRRIIKGVVSGVRDYGNKMGIPTVNGAVLFDERYVGNPLVYCGTVGIIPADKTEKSIAEGDLIVAIGGRTGKDGIHGATFSSVELDGAEVESLSTCVQVGNPIEEKKIMAVIKRSQDQELFTSITDCGAGGFSSSIGELTETQGCRVDLDNIPLKYNGLTYAEMWISESQERMTLIVPPAKLDELKSLCDEEEVELAVLGTVTNTHKLELFYKGECVCSIDMEFLHGGIPRLHKKARYTLKKEKPVKLKEQPRYDEAVKALFGRLNIASKEWVVRQYDHEVQGGSVIKPFMHDGAPQDAAVVRPVLGGKKAVAISNGINPFYADIDPYHMAALAIDEALRNVVAVGGAVDKTSILDNFAWPSPDDPDNLGALVRTSRACYDYAVAFGVPFISGKDSLYNEYTVDGKRIMIPYTLLVSAMSVIDEADKLVTAGYKKAGNLIYAIGLTRDELGSSEYARMNKASGGKVPKVDARKAKKTFKKVHKAIKSGLLKSCHDISDGGLAVAAAEMGFGTGLGCELFLKEVPYKGRKRDDYILFSESASRFVVEVSPENKDAFEKLFKGTQIGLIGCVADHGRFIVRGFEDGVVVDCAVNDLKNNWRNALENKL